MKKQFVRYGVIVCTALWIGGLSAQQVHFDPFLDPESKILPGEKLEEWGSSYMWYPGQLAAHMQEQLKKISEERCVNVGYPGGI